MGNSSSHQKEEKDVWLLSKNLEFYRNERTSGFSSPFRTGHYIEEMLEWKGDHRRLENNHQYIQWLFPNREQSGVNYSAQPLYEHEIQAIREDVELQQRFLQAYCMMLDFYGMYLVSTKTGEVRRSRQCMERFHHLNGSPHNFRRITRILKALGEFGFKKFQVPWLTFILHEALVRQTLPKLGTRRIVTYWINALCDDADKQSVVESYQALSGVTVDTRDVVPPEVDSEPESSIHGNASSERSKSERTQGRTLGYPEIMTCNLETKL